MRTIGYWAALLVVSLAVFGCAAPAPTATPTTPPVAGATPTKALTATPTKRPITKVSVSMSSSSLTWGVPLAAWGAGYPLEEGLDVDWVITEGGTKALAAVVGGSVDFGMMVSTDIYPAIQKGQALRITGAVAIRGSDQMVMRKDVAERLGIGAKSSFEEKAKALKGLKVGTGSPGGSLDQTARVIIRLVGLDPDRDVEITNSTNDGLFAGLRQGQFDVMTVAPPFSTKAVSQGFGVMLISVPDGELPVKADALHAGVTVVKEVLDSRPEIIEGFLRIIWRAERLIQQDRKAALQSIMQTSPYRDANLQETQEGFDANFATFPKTPLITQKMFDDAINFRKMVSPEPVTVTFGEVIDSRFAERAKQQLGF